MQHIIIKKVQFIKTFTLVCLLLVFSIISLAQLPTGDIIPGGTASARKIDFHARFGGSANRVTTKAVKFRIDQLQAILNAYQAAGLSEISFEPALIRSGDDANKYIAKHPELTMDERRSIPNRPTLLIKVPQDGLASLKKARFYVENYFDIGTVCPPPVGSCD